MLLWEPYSWCSSWLDIYLRFGDLGSIYLPSIPFIISWSFGCESLNNLSLAPLFLGMKLTHLSWMLYRFYISFWTISANLIGTTTASVWMVQSEYPRCQKLWVSNCLFNTLVFILHDWDSWSSLPLLQLRHLKMAGLIYCLVMIFWRNVWKCSQFLQEHMRQTHEHFPPSISI